MMEYTLEEDIPVEFSGSTLQINDEVKNGFENVLPKNVVEPAPVVPPVNNWRDSLISPIQKISETLKSKKKDNFTAIQSSAVTLSAEVPTNFFTFREGIVENAVQDCVSNLIDSEIDGKLLGKYLLTEINLWDSDKEKLVLLNENSVISIKYDFIALKILEHRRILLKELDNVVIGALVYPSGSLVPRLNGLADGLTNALQTCLFYGWSLADNEVYNTFKLRERNTKGIRLMWNRGQPLTFNLKWNPFTNDSLFCTLTAHPLYYHKECNEDQKMLYDIENFMKNVTEIIGQLHANNAIIQQKSIVLQNYVGLGSLIHNRNELGYFKVRGKFSF